MLAGAILAASLNVACASSTATPPADPSAVPSFGANDMPPGTKVLVARQGQWLPAAVVQPLQEGRFLVHYDNTGNEWNEVVGPDRIKPVGGPAGNARDFKPGDKVLVTYQSKTLLADVVSQAGPEAWRVHYDGWGPEAVETVGPDRIRRPFEGASGHAVGEAVVVDVNGQPLPAKIIALSAADRWVVRFDAYGAQYDQEVGVDRIRAAPPAVAPPPPPAPPPVAPPPAPTVDKGKDKPKPKAPDSVPTVPSGPPAAGEAVLVNVHGAWFPATVTALAGGKIKLKIGAAEEEWPADHVLREPASTKGLPPYKVGQLVVVAYKGVFVPAKVLRKESRTTYKVRFDGTGPAEDEVVASRRLRPR